MNSHSQVRNIGVEFGRVLMMFGICIIHVMNVNRPMATFDSLSYLHGLVTACVDGFVFISGYYGIRFSVRKLAGLYLTAVYCVVISGFGLYGCGYSVEEAGVASVRQICGGWWFLHAYAVLMFFAPLVNAIFDGDNNPKRLFGLFLPVIVLVFGWTWISTSLNSRGFPFPTATGFDSHSWLTLLGVYVVARLFRVCKVESRVPNGAIVAVVVLLPFLMGLRMAALGTYNSPLALLMASSMFLIFKRFGARISASRVLGRVLPCLTPSLFSVYLIHNSRAGKIVIEKMLGGGVCSRVLLMLCWWRPPRSSCPSHSICRDGLHCFCLGG